MKATRNKLALVMMKIAGKKHRFLGTILEGKQRIKMEKDASQVIEKAFDEGIEVELMLAGFRQNFVGSCRKGTV